MKVQKTALYDIEYLIKKNYSTTGAVMEMNEKLTKRIEDVNNYSNNVLQEVQDMKTNNLKEIYAAVRRVVN